MAVRNALAYVMFRGLFLAAGWLLARSRPPSAITYAP